MFSRVGVLMLQYVVAASWHFECDDGLTRVRHCEGLSEIHYFRGSYAVPMIIRRSKSFVARTFHELATKVIVATK